MFDSFSSKASLDLRSHLFLCHPPDVAGAVESKPVPIRYRSRHWHSVGTDTVPSRPRPHSSAATLQRQGSEPVGRRSVTALRADPGVSVSSRMRAANPDRQVDIRPSPPYHSPGSVARWTPIELCHALVHQGKWNSLKATNNEGREIKAIEDDDSPRRLEWSYFATICCSRCRSRTCSLSTGFKPLCAIAGGSCLLFQRSLFDL